MTGFWRIAVFAFVYVFTGWIRLQAQCAYVGDNGSDQSTNGNCAPISLDLSFNYKFDIPVDPDKVKIYIDWDDGTDTTIVPRYNYALSGKTLFLDTIPHDYPPTGDECTYTAKAYVVYDGGVCLSSKQEQTFRSWNIDNENGGKIAINPERALFCLGDTITQTFADASTFNCNINIEPDKPNNLPRWVQFIYNTYEAGGDRIPNMFVDDNGSHVQLTDNAGNSLTTYYGPIIEIPYEANGPNQISYPLFAPPGGKIGDIMEITMRNWNICNPYDDPSDPLPPTDPDNGDYPPITTTAYIEIIGTPVEVPEINHAVCQGSSVPLVAGPNFASVKWYADSLLTQQLHTGTNYDPTNGSNPYIDNDMPGVYAVWVTATHEQCESAPQKINIEIIANPTPAFAGNDTFICASTISLNANVPSTGTGHWNYSESGILSSTTDPKAIFSNIPVGESNLSWVIKNQQCTSIDNIKVTRELPPGTANAGPDTSFCNTSAVGLNANAPLNGGTGTWSVFSGGATFSNNHAANANITNIGYGTSKLVWALESAHQACPPSSDTIAIVHDVQPLSVDAGPDQQLCDSSGTRLEGNIPHLNANAVWTAFNTTANIQTPTNPKTLITNLEFGLNAFVWSFTSKLGICPVSRDTILVERFEEPAPAFAGNDTMLCDQLVYPLNGSTPSVGQGQWVVVSNPSGVPPVFSPSANDPKANMAIASGNEGEYILMWKISHGPCETSDLVVIDFGVSPPPANAGPDAIVCGLKVNLHANSFTNGTGTWSLVQGPSTVSFAPSINQANAEAVIQEPNYGTYIYQWLLTSGSCVPKMDTVAITYHPIPTQPSTANDSACGPSAFELHAVEGTHATGVRWFSGQNDTLPISIFNQYSTSIIPASRSYWVQSLNDTTLCESQPKEVKISIHPIPGNPTPFALPRCGDGPIHVQAGIGSHASINRWYRNLGDSVFLSQSKNYTTGTLYGDTTLYVSSYNQTTACEGPKVAVPLIVHGLPNPPMVHDTVHCGPAGFLLHADTDTSQNWVNWYKDGASGLPFLQAYEYQTGNIINDTSYWVATVDKTTGCESQRAPMQMAINPLPENPATTDTLHCGPGSFKLSALKGQHTDVLNWYRFPTGGNVYHQGDSLTTGFILNNQVYYVSGLDTTTGCEGKRSSLEVQIVQLPPPQSIVGKSTVTVNESGVIYSVDDHPGSVYDWNIPDSITLVENNGSWIRLSFPIIDVYNISVTETLFGCPGPEANKQITVTDGALRIDLENNHLEACAGAEFILNPSVIGGTSPYSINWSGDIQYLSQTNVLQTSFFTETPGSYELILSVTDYNYKSVQDTIYLTVHESPVASIVVPDTFVCMGGQIPVSVNYTSQTSTNQHSWTGRIAALSSTNTANTVFTPFEAGRYQFNYVIKDGNNCYATDTINLYSEEPVAYFEADKYSGCSPLEVEFRNLSPTESTGLTWDFNDGSPLQYNNDTAIHVFRNQSPALQYFDVELEIVTEKGCKDVHKTTITVFPNPAVEINATPKEICSPGVVTFNAVQGGINYQWDFGDGTKISSGYNTAHLYENRAEKDTVYQVKLVTTSGFQCVDSAKVDITVHPSPEANFVVSPAEQMFPDTVVAIQNKTTGNWDYKWYFGDGTESAERNPAKHAYQSPNHYTISLVASSKHCKDSLPKSVIIRPAPPIAKFAPVDPGCLPHTISPYNESSHAHTYYWEFGDGSVSNKPNPSYTYYEPGIYKIKLTVVGDGGTDSHSDTSEVYVLPRAFFDLAPRFVYVNDEPVYYFNLSDHADMVEWDFGDGQTSTEYSPKHYYMKEGTYDVTLKVWTENHCYDLYTMENAVLVEPSGTVVYPNVFRPLSPVAENREFMPAIIDNVDDYHLMIFNRWGDLIFESFNRDTGWDGFFKGEPAQQDVYIWKVKGTYTNGQAFQETGDVTLLH